MAQSKRSREMVEGALGLPMASDQVGLGVDIVEIERMRAILRRSPAFARRAFSEGERAYCDAKANPEAHYATRFAAKEAVLKALGTGFADGIGPRDVEVRRTKKGRPYVVLSGRARAVALEQGVREVPVSLSFTHSEAVACAMAITQDAQTAAKKREDPLEELAKQFKDARALLDELPATGGVAGAKAPGAAGIEATEAAAAEAAKAPGGDGAAAGTSQADASGERAGGSVGAVPAPDISASAPAAAADAARAAAEGDPGALGEAPEAAEAAR